MNSPPKKPPKKPKNRDRRTREYLMPDEVEALMKAARHVGRHRIRDYTLILMMYRHGLRVSEVIDLRWEGGLRIKNFFGHYNNSFLKIR